MSEREAIVAILREICSEFGDNDWPDELHPADVIEKHLAKHLWSREPPAWTSEPPKVPGWYLRSDHSLWTSTEYYDIEGGRQAHFPGVFWYGPIPEPPA